jgi:hypothetical protein
MFEPFTRRRFLQATAAGSAAIGLGDLRFLTGLPRVSADEVRNDPKVVQFRPEIEPLVRLLEETPREKLLEEVAARIHRGTTYREILAALLLAGVRNIQPRPVGFKFHAVLVVNSAHLASISSPDAHRWLPIFWALDEFKSSQAQDVREGDWTMAPVEESAVPRASKAREAFCAAMDNWDVAAADAAVAGLARSLGEDEVFEIMFRYGCRDFRDIGHKAIYVANSMRTLRCIGWQHAEPVLRSLAYALLYSDKNQTNPAKNDLPPDRPGRRNAELAKKIRGDWQDGQPDESATVELLAALRQANDEGACDKVVELLNRGVAVQSLYDALHLAAGEMLMRQPGIVALHAVTSTNALRFAYQTSAQDETRRLLLLQNAAFLTLFRDAMNSRGKVADVWIDQLEPAPLDSSDAADIGEIFADVSSDRMLAARKMLAYARVHPQPKELIDAARVLVFIKGTNAHDYKFSSALLEDYYNVSPGWRERFLATGAFNLRGSGDRDNTLVQRTRAALA